MAQNDPGPEALNERTTGLDATEVLDPCDAGPDPRDPAETADVRGGVDDGVARAMPSLEDLWSGVICEMGRPERHCWCPPALGCPHRKKQSRLAVSFLALRCGSCMPSRPMFVRQRARHAKAQPGLCLEPAAARTRRCGYRTGIRRPGMFG